MKTYKNKKPNYKIKRTNLKLISICQFKLKMFKYKKKYYYRISMNNFKNHYQLSKIRKKIKPRPKIKV